VVGEAEDPVEYRDTAAVVVDDLDFVEVVDSETYCC
jgi:hypothetical protein